MPLKKKARPRIAQALGRPGPVGARPLWGQAHGGPGPMGTKKKGTPVCAPAPQLARLRENN